MKLVFVGLAFLLSASCCAAAADDAELRAACDAGWAKAMTTWYPKTALVYECKPEQVRKSTDCINNLFHWYKGSPDGYGAGMGDCALICGTALSGLCDKWGATKDAETKADAAKVARGVLNLAKLHGIKGFVARGICADDGKSICSLSSRDQYTHWVHGLWRYVTSDMADPALVAEFKTLIAEVAAFMERKITPENEWNFGLADGSKDPRGICTMWGPDVWPHEAARLPMIYAAAFMATGDRHWRDVYEKYIDEAIERTLKIKTMPPHQIEGRMPCYSLFQANTSFEPILAYEKNPARVAKIKDAMAAFAKLAHDRAATANPTKPPYGMCWDGELALTQLMSPPCPDPDGLRTFIEQTILRQDLTRSGVCRAAHVMAAYWRARRCGLFSGL